MQRRGFLASILAAGVAPAFVGSKILMPVRQILTPQWQDHLGAAFDVLYTSRGPLLTTSMIAREALLILNKQLFLDSAAIKERREWAPAVGEPIHIRRTQRYVTAITKNPLRDT